MSWNGDDRIRFAEGLDRTKRRLSAFYGWLLVSVAIAFIAYVGFAVWQSRDATGSQGEWFYLGAFVLLVLGWIGRQLLSLRGSSPTRLDMPPIRGRAEEIRGGRIFKFSMGTPPPPTADPSSVDRADPDVRTFTFSRSFGARVPLPSVFQEHTPDAEALTIAEEYREAGRDWDYICERVNPRYGTWDGVRQSLYRRYLEALLDAQRQGYPPAP